MNILLRPGLLELVALALLSAAFGLESALFGQNCGCDDQQAVSVDCIPFVWCGYPEDGVCSEIYQYPGNAPFDVDYGECKKVAMNAEGGWLCVRLHLCFKSVQGILCEPENNYAILRLYSPYHVTVDCTEDECPKE